MMPLSLTEQSCIFPPQCWSPVRFLLSLASVEIGVIDIFPNWLKFLLHYLLLSMSLYRLDTCRTRRQEADESESIVLMQRGHDRGYKAAKVGHYLFYIECGASSTSKLLPLFTWCVSTSARSSQRFAVKKSNKHNPSVLNCYSNRLEFKLKINNKCYKVFFINHTFAVISFCNVNVRPETYS